MSFRWRREKIIGLQLHHPICPGLIFCYFNSFLPSCGKSFFIVLLADTCYPSKWPQQIVSQQTAREVGWPLFSWVVFWSILAPSCFWSTGLIRIEWSEYNVEMEYRIQSKHSLLALCHASMGNNWVPRSLSPSLSHFGWARLIHPSDQKDYSDFNCKKVRPVQWLNILSVWLDGASCGLA